MITIFQVIIGSLPKMLIPMVSSVEKFVARNGHNYEVITERDPDIPEHFCTRSATNWIRARRLQTPGMMYIDWDVRIKRDFEIGDDPIIGLDHLFYFGSRMDMAAALLSKLGDPSKSKLSLGASWNAIYSLYEEGMDFGAYQLSKKYYLHLGYAGTKL